MEQTQLQAAWEHILTKMKETLAESAFKWFSSVKPLSLTDTEFVLSAQNELVKEWITSHYLTIVEDAVSAVLGTKHKVVFEVLPPAAAPEPSSKEADGSAEAKKAESTAAAHAGSRKKRIPTKGRSFRNSRPQPSIPAICTLSPLATVHR